VVRDEGTTAEKVAKTITGTLSTTLPADDERAVPGSDSMAGDRASSSEREGSV
jgi:hypothetical protein